jgi:hypothetical protein
VHVQLGPLPAEGVRLWLAYARVVLDRLEAKLAGDEPPALPGGVPTVPPDLVDTFSHFLDEWEAAARGDTFTWSDEVDPEQARYLAHFYFALVSLLADEAQARGFPVAPPEGDEFYLALVSAFLDALAQEGGDNTAFVDELRVAWPGLKPEA